ncbi:rod shape-determining protein MreC [Chitinophaga sp. YIM B06452]|uniref:rod shape-determining protein MreC n=1 Tax=Chitinophaga sp. YIM B06452 TaxID=3082158 RepID=UPI0031FE9FEA
MRNLIIFLRRYFNFFLFLLLEVICFVFVFRTNNHQRAVYLNSANSVSGKLYTQYNGIQYYFHLKATNDSLVKENLRLHNELSGSFDVRDTSASIVFDTLRKFSNDTARKLLSTEVRKFLYREAKVINNSVNREINTITIRRGSKDGVRPNMGVIGPNGVVGVVRSVSENYAVVISLLYKSRGTGNTSNFGVSARLRNSGETGTVGWDGMNAGYVQMKDIPRSAKLHKGDTVVTSGYSAVFPENLPVGYIDTFYVSDKSSTAYTIRLKLATNFYNLQYVYVIENLLRDEQTRLEDSTRNLLK